MAQVSGGAAAASAGGDEAPAVDGAAEPGDEEDVPCVDGAAEPGDEEDVPCVDSGAELGDEDESVAAVVLASTVVGSSACCFACTINNSLAANLAGKVTQNF